MAVEQQNRASTPASSTPVGRIHQINVSPGGVPKRPVSSATVGDLGIQGDTHVFIGHGGPERALCLYSLERIQALRSEGHPVNPGSLGENITTEGIDLKDIQPGDRLALGQQVVVQMTRHTTPCHEIQFAFNDGDSTRILQDKHPGWSRFYTRVLTGGTIQQGDDIRRLPRS